MSVIYGYARVSSIDQNLNRQLDSFYELGILNKNIFTDKQSGKDFNRKNYLILIKKLKQDDILVIKSIDRLGRNYEGIIEEWNRLTNIIKCKIYVIDMPLLDTRNESKTLVNKFISDIVLQVLSFVAQNERENIRQRQKEGIIAAKKRGVKFGRPEKELPQNFYEVVELYNKKELTLKKTLILLNMNKSTFFLKLKKLKKNPYLSTL